MKVFEWDDLRIFLAVLRGRSVRAASKLLGVSHSTVSRRLQAMEQQVGVKLFVRQAEGFVLTEVGEVMVARAERVEGEILSLEREVFGRDAALAGTVRISAPPLIAQYLLIPHLAEFAETYPEISIDVEATFDVADLRRRNADIAVRFSSSSEDGLIGHKLPDLANAIYATPDYTSRHSFNGPSATARWVALGNKTTLAHWRDETPFSHCKVQHFTTDPLVQLRAISAGMGFGYLFCFVADHQPDLIRMPGNSPLQHIPVWVLTHPDLDTTERVRVCVRFLVDAISKQAQELSGLTVTQMQS